MEKNFGIIIGQGFGIGEESNWFTLIAFDGRLEFDDIMVELDAGLALIYAWHFFLDIGVDYYLTHTAISPYIGGGAGAWIGERLQHCSSGSDEFEGSSEHCDESMDMAGGSVFPQIGLEFFRGSSIRVHMDVRYGLHFAKDAFGHGPIVIAGINF